MTAAFLICAIGLPWMSRIGVHTPYVSHILDPEIIIAIGLAGVLAPTTNLNIRPRQDDRPCRPSADSHFDR
ncbi:hypothetical protein [Frankia tisae]|uniref:hypothetical protein n=1 Tax=Frankia tisae TaxID=2950104 RepID=UPI0021C24EB9|nr:hypothetical protein [Frankia tisae]